MPLVTFLKNIKKKLKILQNISKLYYKYKLQIFKQFFQKIKLKCKKYTVCIIVIYIFQGCYEYIVENLAKDIMIIFFFYFFTK